MTRKQSNGTQIPEFKSREEEAEFWDTHDFTDYWGEFEQVDAKDVVVADHLSSGLTVPLTPDLLMQLIEQAKQIGIGPSALARKWIVEHLQETHPRS